MMADSKQAVARSQLCAARLAVGRQQVSACSACSTGRVLVTVKYVNEQARRINASQRRSSRQTEQVGVGSVHPG